MQRDVGNEVIVAILAVAVLAFALIFAIILSLSGGSGGATVVDNPTAALTDMVPSMVDDETEEATETEAATDTPQPTEESTEDPTATTTSTDVPASDTPESSPTASREPTIESTSTPRPTNTREPNDAPTNTPRPTRTPRPTQTATTSATSTDTVSCLAPVGWRTYTVQPGDTLASIAAATGSEMADLLSANCLEADAKITPGQAIFVQRLAGDPVSTPRTVVEGAPRPVGCTVPSAQITSPASGQRVSGVFRVVGTANIAQFDSYRIEVRPDFVASYDIYEEFDEPVTNGQLARVDSDAYGNGLHWVRLSVVSTLDSSAAVTCAIPMFFD